MTVRWHTKGEPMVQDERQIKWVAAAIADELAKDGVHLTADRLHEIGSAATSACINWLVAAKKEGMI